MKNTDLREIIILLLCCFLCANVCGAKDKEEGYFIPRHDLTAEGTATEGNYTVEAVIYQQKPDKGIDSALRKAAVYGTIFKGITGKTGAPSQRPLAPASAEAAHPEFFSRLFGEDEYRRYADVIGSSLRVEKGEKRLYRIRAVVVVHKDSLRRLLEENGILESFNDLF